MNPGADPGTAVARSSPDPLTTAALAARDGDANALRAFLAGTQDPVRRFCATMAPDLDTDDLVQETYLRAWRALGGFRGESSVTTWLMSIARRVGIEAVTRGARQRRSEENPARWAPTDDAAGVIGLTDLIGRLDPDRREALVLTRLVGLSYAEAARVAECEVGTIRSRVSRARQQLLDWLGEESQR